MQSVAKKRVGVLRGGTGGHYSSSLKKGGELISHISENLSDKYKTFDILIDRDGVWHINGMPTTPPDLINKVDVVWNTSEPSLSLDLDKFSIPNVGNNTFASILENNRDMLKEHIKNLDINIPKSVVLPLYQADFDGPRERYSIKKAKEIFEKFSSPWIIKSFTPDSGMAIHLAKTFPELVDAIEDGVRHEKSILVEEFITGKVASMHSVPNFRGEACYTFPLLNTLGTSGFSSGEKEKLANLVKNLHIHLGAKHYLKSDFVLNPRGKIYLLGVDFIPNLKQNSHLSQACEIVGAKTQNIIEHIIEQAM